MGCASSKSVKASADVYRPAPSSFAVFDINAIEEPWLIVDHAAPQQQQQQQQNQEKPPTHVHHTILDKLEATDAPHSWDEVSKALENHLKHPTHNSANKTVAHVSKELATSVEPAVQVSKPPPPSKSFSFHTLEDLQAKTAPPANNNVPLRKAESTRAESTRTESTRTESRPSPTGFRSVKENIFVVKDRLEREKEGNKKPVVNWDPLREFPEKCPPGGGADSVVVYTTSLRGVRRTHEDCLRVRALLEQQGVVFDERDVSLHGGFLGELKELLEEEVVAPPRVFLKGRYIGGAEEVEKLNETGKLGRILRWARVERVGGEGRSTCEGCGGVRWVPCLDCGGSCKVRAAAGDGWERCDKCNENGLVRCPVCLK